MFRYLFLILILISYMSTAAEARAKRPCTGDEATVACLKKNFEEVYEKAYIQFQIIIGFAESKAVSCASVDDTAAYLDLAPETKGNPEVEEYFREFIEEKFVKTNVECLLNGLLKTGDDARKIILGNYLRKPIVLTADEVGKALSPFKTHEKFGEMLKLYFGE
ncbi:MAG: hypothetical protein OEV28_07225 [Nitrospirota bacterium]|nr:hypothetical protein [Nitrospirota bacterium]